MILNALVSARTFSLDFGPKRLKKKKKNSLRGVASICNDLSFESLSEVVNVRFEAHTKASKN